MSNWPEIKKKIREQIKDWKNIHAEWVTVEKIKRKKKKKETENVVGKRKKQWKKKKKTKDNTNIFYFYFSDFWAWDWRMFFVVLFFWNCIAENIVAQFDMWRRAQ